MALALAEIVIFSLIIDWLFRKVRLPGLVGMLLLGVILGPYALGCLNPDLLAIAADLRLIALIIILLRAGFELSKDTLNKVGKMAARLSFIPASFEAVAITILAPHFLGLTYLESAVLGFVLSAVSPAVVVPLMIRFIEQGKGVEKGIPSLVLAGASMDDVYVITVYSALIGIYTGHKVNVIWKLATIPISICLGIGAGLLIGYFLYHLFDRFNPRATKRVLLIIGISILLVQFERLMKERIPFAALLGVMAIGFIILEKRESMAHEISARLGKIWVFAEIMLFVMVGVQVNIPVALRAGLAGCALIGLALIARSIGTFLCVCGSNLTLKEKMFVVVSYLPKATVQAAFGAAPLAAMRLAGMNSGPGELILAVAILSIILTAPLGAFAISMAGEHWLAVAPATLHQDYDAAVASEGILNTAGIFSHSPYLYPNSEPDSLKS
ncbi:MAG: cation:proton antiporter [bacterium]|nr:cation:proton antiporter [bacterium]